MEAARRAEQELGAEIEIIKKTSKEYGQMKNPLPCPTVMVNGRIIEPSRTLFRENAITFEEMKTAILGKREFSPQDERSHQ